MAAACRGSGLRRRAFYASGSRVGAGPRAREYRRRVEPVTRPSLRTPEGNLVSRRSQAACIVSALLVALPGPALAAPRTTVTLTLQDTDDNRLLQQAPGEPYIVIGREQGFRPPPPRLDHQLPPSLGLPDSRRGIPRPGRVPGGHHSAGRRLPALRLRLPASGGAHDSDHRGDDEGRSQHDFPCHERVPRARRFRMRSTTSAIALSRRS
jgi:hypothetical protein